MPRLDADVIEWFKRHADAAERYQTGIVDCHAQPLSDHTLPVLQPMKASAGLSPRFGAGERRSRDGVDGNDCWYRRPDLHLRGFCPQCALLGGKCKAVVLDIADTFIIINTPLLH